MKNVCIKQKLIVTALAGAIMIPGRAITAKAAGENEDSDSPLPIAGIETVLTECYKSDVKDNINLYLVPTNEGEYLNRAFSNVSDFTYIRSAPDEYSDWTGKLYPDSTVTVLEYVGDWVKIQSGNAFGYVPETALYTGEQAQQRAKEFEKTKVTVTAGVLNVRSGQSTETQILTQVYAGETYLVTGEAVYGWYPVMVGETSGWVCGDYVDLKNELAYGESREEEERRLAEEAAAAARAAAGQAVVDFACQYIGYPYVWGGTSLTNGADCSGFVQAVYREFGISLPRTTWAMEGSGYGVSYADANPGDLIVYSGHVGIYMGDGTIVNSRNAQTGIGISNVDTSTIVAVRRVL